MTLDKLFNLSVPQCPHLEVCGLRTESSTEEPLLAERTEPARNTQHLYTLSWDWPLSLLLTCCSADLCWGPSCAVRDVGRQHQMSFAHLPAVTAPPLVVTTKKISKVCQMSPGGHSGPRLGATLLKTYWI